MQNAKLKVSTLFLDIEGGFDNVVKYTLTTTLAAKSTPPYIINWVLSFLSDRHITLFFKGSPSIPTPVQIGVLQGSPIYSVLFVIYMNILHLHDPSPVITLSHTHDFAITVGSSSYQQNIHILQEHFRPSQPSPALRIPHSHPTIPNSRAGEPPKTSPQSVRSPSPSTIQSSTQATKSDGSGSGYPLTSTQTPILSTAKPLPKSASEISRDSPSSP